MISPQLQCSHTSNMFTKLMSSLSNVLTLPICSPLQCPHPINVLTPPMSLPHQHTNPTNVPTPPTSPSPHQCSLSYALTPPMYSINPSPWPMALPLHCHDHQKKNQPMSSSPAMSSPHQQLHTINVLSWPSSSPWVGTSDSVLSHLGWPAPMSMDTKDDPPPPICQLTHQMTSPVCSWTNYLL